jgi:topoisomerase-4 subunit A
MLLASRAGRGFVVPEDDLLANTRKGKAVMGVDLPDELAAVRVVEGDHVAVIGQNRKLLVFPLAQVPEMPRGKGVRLQKYKEGGMVDVKTFALDEGLTWKDSSDRTWTVAKADLTEWLGTRADAGRLPPKGFPKNNRFG